MNKTNRYEKIYYYQNCKTYQKKSPRCEKHETQAHRIYVQVQLR